jgi:hypothetical protein
MALGPGDDRRFYAYVLKHNGTPIWVGLGSGSRHEVKSHSVRFEAPTTPPDNVLATLDVHQQAVAALMKPDWAGLSGMDWAAIYSQRLRERLKCGAAREMAVVEAFQHVLTDWLNGHLQASSPIRCAHRGRPEDASYAGVLLPFGIGPHAWVHSCCWEAWRAGRLAKAIEALAGYGLALRALRVPDVLSRSRPLPLPAALASSCARASTPAFAASNGVTRRKHD